MALSSTDPKVLMGQAKCFSCLSPKLQYQLRTYLLALIAMGDTSITGVQTLSTSSTCFSCLTHGELLAAKQYLMAVWLGLDTTKTGIIAQAATAACDYACLTPVQAEQVRTYLLAVTAGVATDAAGVRALELAAKCFECPTNKRQLEMQVYLLSTLAPGAPTTASAIIAAAKCFLTCVPPELHEAFQTSLFAQVAGRSTPPCVTPSAPTSVQATTARVADPTTQLLVRWLQPANSGTLITGYTVFWGTTAGGPYTNNSGLLPGGSKLYTITGLTAGTTYYIVVQADTSISGCVSANSAEANATTSGAAPIDPVVTNWSNRVVINGGGAPSQATIIAVDTFYKGLKSDGLDTLMIAVNIIAPDNITAALTPLIVGPGFDPWTNIGAMNAGSISTSGLLVNGTTQCMDSGVSPATAFTSANDFGITGYTGNNTGLYSLEIGSFDNVNIAEIDIQGVGSGILAGAWAAWNINVAGLLSGSVFGFTSVSRITTMAAYQANSIIGFNTVTSGVAGSQVRPTPTLAVAGRNTNGAFTATIRSCWYTFAAMHHGLTAAQTQALFNRVQTLRTTFGGGFG